MVAKFKIVKKNGAEGKRKRHLTQSSGEAWNGGGP